MRNIDENTITTAILERTKDGDNRGLKEVPGALIRPALDFDGEARPTESARLAGIEFLTATGHKCDDKRQESLLLFDPLGESTLTVALNDANPREYAKCPLLGFFQVDVASRFELGVDISGGASRAPLFVSAHVRTADGTPVCDAGVDIGQACEERLYDLQQADPEHFYARAVSRSDDEGNERLRTVLPVYYAVPPDCPIGRMLLATRGYPWCLAPVHFMTTAAPFEGSAIQVFRDDDASRDVDAVFQVRQSLIAKYFEHPVEELPDRSQSARPLYPLACDFVLHPRSPVGYE